MPADIGEKRQELLNQLYSEREFNPHAEKIIKLTAPSLLQPKTAQLIYAKIRENGAASSEDIKDFLNQQGYKIGKASYVETRLDAMFSSIDKFEIEDEKILYCFKEGFYLKNKDFIDKAYQNAIDDGILQEK